MIEPVAPPISASTIPLREPVRRIVQADGKSQQCERARQPNSEAALERENALGNRRSASQPVRHATEDLAHTSGSNRHGRHNMLAQSRLR